MATLSKFLSIGRTKWVERTCLFILKKLLRSCSQYFYLHPLGQNLATWPNIATRELRNIVFFPSSDVPAYNVGFYYCPIPTSVASPCSVLTTTPPPSSATQTCSRPLNRFQFLPAEGLCMRSSPLDHSPPAQPTLPNYSIIISPSGLTWTNTPSPKQSQMSHYMISFVALITVTFWHLVLWLFDSWLTSSSRQ